MIAPICLDTVREMFNGFLKVSSRKGSIAFGLQGAECSAARSVYISNLSDFQCSVILTLKSVIPARLTADYWRIVDLIASLPSACAQRSFSKLYIALPKAWHVLIPRVQYEFGDCRLVLTFRAFCSLVCGKLLYILLGLLSSLLKVSAVYHSPHLEK